MTDIIVQLNRMIFLGSSSIIVATFGLYGLFLLFYSLKGKSGKNYSSKSFKPTVSIVLPTFNEGKFIRQKIENLLDTKYKRDKIEIIIVDDSTDEESRKEISKLASKISCIKVHSRLTDRRGYSKALLDGFSVASGEIIIITDCGSMYESDTIDELVIPFSDPKVGGVTGAANILNEYESSGKNESFYRKIYNFMRKSESNADSTFHFHGEVSSVRKDLLTNLPCFPTNLDIAIAFHIRKQGYRVIFNSEAKFNEYAPEKYRERQKQKTIRATGLILVLLGYRGMFSPQYGLFGLIIYPAHLSMMILCPLSFLSGSFSFAFLMGTEPHSWIIILLLLITVITIIFLIKKEIIANLFQFEIVLLQAIWTAIKNKNEVIYIEKIKSTRRN